MKKTELKQMIREEITKALNEGTRKYPKGWKRVKTDSEDDESWEGKVIAMYSAPMEGWDEEHPDFVVVVKREDGFYLTGYLAFDEFQEEGPFSTQSEAEKKAYEAMKELMEAWEDDDDY